MGSTAHLVAMGPVDVRRGLDDLRSLEARWSRFRDTSELSRLGRLGGAPAVVSTQTALLIAISERARLLTGGLFDATVLDRLEAAGYDRSFELLQPAPAPDGHVSLDAPGPPPGPAPGRAPIDRASGLLVEADPRTGLVRLPPGVRIDPGGIGKGLAADLVAGGLLDRGATGSLVSVGGDLRVIGTPPVDGWEVELDHHVVAPARINLRAGAVATSTRLRRRWRTTRGVAHHIIDPRTGRPSDGPAVAVSVVAAEAWRAEAIATAVLVGYLTPGFDELAPELLADAGALVTTADRRRHRLGPLGESFVVLDESVPAGTPLHISQLDIPQLDNPQLDNPQLDNPSMEETS